MKEFILDLDKPRELRFGFKALRMIRQKFGDRPVEQILNIKVDEIPIVAHAGLKWEESSLTVEKVENLLDEAIPRKYTVLGITEIIVDALTEQMGLPGKKEKAGEQEKITEGIPVIPEETAAKPAGKKISTKKSKK